MFTIYLVWILLMNEREMEMKEMKFWLVLIVMLPLSVYGQEGEKKLQVAEDTITYTVYGMDCPGCEGGLEKQVNKIPWVGVAEANWVKQQLKVVVKKDSAANRDDIEFRVKKANFTLAEDTKKKKQ